MFTRYKTQLHAQLQQKLVEIREARKFNPETWIDAKCRALNKYMKEAGLKACVVSVSGGIDSTVTAALVSRASTIQGSPIERIMLLKQPIHSTAGIADRADKLGVLANVDLCTIDQTEVFDQLRLLVNTSVGIAGQTFADGNLRSYMRTPVAFYVAQLLSQSGMPAIVVGTGNRDEDGYLYYFSKAGDGISDIQLIHDLHKDEVYRVAAALQLDQELISAVPSADLWDGQTDEDEIGWSYDAVELWTELLDRGEDHIAAFSATLCPEARQQFDSMRARLESIHNHNRHKSQISHGI